MKKYRRKGIYKAVQYKGNNFDELVEAFGEAVVREAWTGAIGETKESVMVSVDEDCSFILRRWDYVVKEHGNEYPCIYFAKNFKELFEEVEK